MDCQIIDLISYRKENTPQSPAQACPKTRSKLKMVQALVDVYEVQMQAMAQDPEVKDLCNSQALNPREQIASDVKRLRSMVDCLQQGVEEKGAKDLSESVNLMRYWAQPEVVGTLDRVLVSEYRGFQEMVKVLAS